MRPYEGVQVHPYAYVSSLLSTPVCVCTYVSVALTNSCQSTPFIPPLRRPPGGGGVCVCVGCTFTTQAGANKSRQRRNNYTGRVCVWHRAHTPGFNASSRRYRRRALHGRGRGRWCGLMSALAPHTSTGAIFSV